MERVIHSSLPLLIYVLNLIIRITLLTLDFQSIVTPDDLVHGARGTLAKSLILQLVTNSAIVFFLNTNLIPSKLNHQSLTKIIH